VPKNHQVQNEGDLMWARTSPYHFSISV